MIAATRETRYQPSAWDLSELIPEPTRPALSELLTGLDDAVTAFAARRPELGPGMSPESCLAILKEYEALVARMIVLSSYVSLWFSSDTQSQAALTYQNQVQQALVAAGNRTLFFELWWKGLSDPEAAALTPSAPGDADYAHFLAELRRFKPFTLEERSEQLISLKDANGIDALLTLYSVLTNRLEFTLVADGEERTLTRDELTSRAFSPSPQVRAAAYQELFRVYAREATPLAQIYANRVRDWYNENVELRGYPSPIAARNRANDVPDEAVEVLLAVVRDNAGLFHRFFRAKARLLGLERLRRYDVYAPLADSDREVPFAAGVELVLDTFAGFHPRFAEQARRVFAESHLDSEVRKGKRGGAFCATVLPRQTPWVLVNYTGRQRDVLTLAHELGHAVHSMMAGGHTLLTQRASLPLAETASVFAEMLMTDRFLAEETDPLVRREMLVTSIDNIYATVLRQAYFVLFERRAHEAIRGGESPDGLNALYLDNLAEQFGDSVEVTPDFQYEWLTIPHIYNTPFYCYAYCFGQLLVLALYRRYQQEGEAFKPGYLRMLTHGGSARPREVLAEAGVDATDPAFWRGGFEVIAGMVDELESTAPGPG
jgi:oligoendopeptidase F